MSNALPLTLPPPVSFIVSGSATPTAAGQLPPPYGDNRPSSAASSFVIVVIIIASAVIVSATIYILLRLLSRRFHRSFRTFAAADDVASSGPSLAHHLQQQRHVSSGSLLDNLPLFTFDSVTGGLAGGDCAVCLSRFEPHDQLRLLPLCCHAFHAACIDAWIVANQTCPLCRSTVHPSDSEILDKLVAADQNLSSINGGAANHENSSNFRNGSFRVEIGSVSRRRDGAADRERQRSYSIGSFDYILDGDGHEVPVGSTNNHRRGISASDKESLVGVPVPEPPGEVLAAEVAGGGVRNWLRDYVDRLASVSISSRAMSFRSSGRFFSGSSRRSEVVAVAAEDLEANRVGEEISELFRWISGI